MANLSRFIRSHDQRRGAVLYRFPNGTEVSVIPDPTSPLRWELLVDGEPKPEPYLTTEQAETRLTELAALPMPEWDGKS